MDAILSTFKDIGEKRWIIYFYFPSIFFCLFIGILYFDINIGLSNIVSWWANLADEAKFINGLGFLCAAFFISVILDFSSDKILNLFSGLEHTKSPIQWLYSLGRSSQIKKYRKIYAEYQKIATKQTEHSYDEQYRLASLDELLSEYPVSNDRIRPTELGNILAAASEYPGIRYGLDFRTTWPRMIYTLGDENFRNALIENRMRLDLLLRTYILTVLCFVFASVWSLNKTSYWIFALLLLGAVFGLKIIYKWGVSAAREYADLIRSFYDLYRFDLYKLLLIPLPESSLEKEIEAGQLLSSHLWRGTAQIKYTKNDNVL